MEIFRLLPKIHLVSLDATFKLSDEVLRGNAHSQMVATRQPKAFRHCSAFASRFLFPLIFFLQNEARVLGRRKFAQSWPCQKHPFTKITALYLGSTMSGFPGSSFTCSRKRKPSAWMALLIIRSGRVFLPFMDAIIRLRVAVSTVSANSLHPCLLCDDSIEGLPHMPCDRLNDWYRY